jgi:hypothetical protein
MNLHDGRDNLPNSARVLKWDVASRVVENVRFAVEKKQLTPLAAPP